MLLTWLSCPVLRPPSPLCPQSTPSAAACLKEARLLRGVPCNKSTLGYMQKNNNPITTAISPVLPCRLFPIDSCPATPYSPIVSIPVTTSPTGHCPLNHCRSARRPALQGTATGTATGGKLSPGPDTQTPRHQTPDTRHLLDLGCSTGSNRFIKPLSLQTQILNCHLPFHCFSHTNLDS